MGNGQRVFLTGGSGFIGRSLQAALQSADCSVIAPTRSEWDLEQPSSLSATRLEGADVIVHCAASRTRGERSAPATRWQTEIALNLDATARLCDLARTAGVRHLIYLSSLSALQPADEILASLEDDAPPIASPASPYGLTKAWAEVFLTSLRGDAKSGLSTVTILRPATVYGPETPPLSGFQRRIAALQSPEGATIAAPDGYLHNPLFIDDLIDVLVRLCLLPRNLTANVGGPTAMTEGELLRDLGAQLSQRSDSVGAPRIRIDASSQAVSYVVSNAAINRAFPERMQTAWLTGLRQCF